MKLIKFVGAALNEFSKMPEDLKINFGYQLLKWQLCEFPITTQSILGFDNANVIEFRENFAGDTNRAIYTLIYDNDMYILHFFTKKINSSFSDMQATIDLINARIKMIGDNEVKSSGNIFSDIGLLNAEEVFLKAQMSYKIDQELKKRSLTQAKAAKLLEIPQPRISQIINGKFQDVSGVKLMRCLNKLVYNINIQVEPTTTNNLGIISLLFKY